VTVTSAPVSLLLSYWYYRKDADVASTAAALDEATAAGVNIRLLIDSGAFSAHTQGAEITVESFAEWLDTICVPRYGDYITGIFNLDVIRNPEASWQNWNGLRELGHNTMPVVHLGAPTEVMDRYVKAGADYIGLGGLVKAPGRKRLSWAKRMHRHVRDEHPHVRLHGLGVSGTEFTRKMPWFSVDSTSMIVSLMYKVLRIYDPVQHKLVSEPMFDPSAPGRSRNQVQFSQSFQRTLRQTYGVPPELVMTAGPGNRQLYRELAGRVVEQFQEDARRRRLITPPPSLAHDFDGTHVHGVYVPEDLIGMLRATYNPLTLEPLTQEMTT
tara:strand:- start:216 stop:1193 length:978 start_codon:yes stop_codon:yes gene_type:complete